MTVAKIIELSSTSDTSFEDAISRGIKRASKTVKQIQGAWVKEQKVKVKDNKIVEYRVNLNVTFILEK